MANHWYLCGTFPDVNDYRFLFDISRLHRAIKKCSTADASIRCYSKVEDFWKPFIDAVKLVVQHGLNDQHVLEEISEQLHLEPPSSLLQDLSVLKVNPGSHVFIWLTNHGSATAFSLSKTSFFDFKQLMVPLQNILLQGASIFLAISACGSRSFARPLAEEFRKHKFPISIFTDDPDTSSSANISLKENPSLQIGTEFCQAFLAFLSNWKATDQHTIEDLATFMPNKFYAFLGENRKDSLKQYLGPNIADFNSPLCRAPGIQYLTVFPFNGEHSRHRGISAEYHKLLHHILGHPLSEPDFKFDKVKIEDSDESRTLTTKLLHILAREGFIVPGLLSGGDTVFLLASLNIQPEELERFIKDFRARKPQQPQKFESVFDEPE
jgi:hypothetical protein